MARIREDIEKNLQWRVGGFWCISAFYSIKSSGLNSLSEEAPSGVRLRGSYLYLKHFPNLSVNPFLEQNTSSLYSSSLPWTQYIQYFSCFLENLSFFIFSILNFDVLIITELSPNCYHKLFGFLTDIINSIQHIISITLKTIEYFVSSKRKSPCVLKTELLILNTFKRNEAITAHRVPCRNLKNKNLT